MTAFWVHSWVVVFNPQVDFASLFNRNIESICSTIISNYFQVVVIEALVHVCNLHIAKVVLHLINRHIEDSIPCVV